MLVIEMARRVAAEVADMPRLVHIGLAIGIVAFLADVLVHLTPASHPHDGFRPEEHLAHLAGLVAMVVVLAGVVVDGARRHRRRTKEEIHAPR